jgi:hypothetical protein
MWALYIAIAIFGSTSIIGMYLSSLVFRGIETSVSAIKIHSALSLVGFIILFRYYPASFTCIFYFSAATVCGVILLYQDLTGQLFSRWLCYAHGIFSIAGMIYLLVLTSHQST